MDSESQSDRSLWGSPRQPRSPTNRSSLSAKRATVRSLASRVDQNDIELKFSNGTLTIKGKKKQETEEKKENYYPSERRYGAFERSFQVPQDVDETKIEASFSKGLLTVTLPKRAEAQKLAKTIAVKAA